VALSSLDPGEQTPAALQDALGAHLRRFPAEDNGLCPNVAGLGVGGDPRPWVPG